MRPVISVARQLQPVRQGAWRSRKYPQLLASQWRCTATRFSHDTALSQQTEPHYVTTPIFYVNAAPHIGHLHTIVLADCLHRRELTRGRKSISVSGTDEHGSKVFQAASKAKTTPQQFCDDVSAKFRHLVEAAGAAITDFVRTTEDRHRRAVQHIWCVLRDAGHIRMGSYTGWYSTQDEAFLADSQVETRSDAKGNPIKVSAETGAPVTRMTEDNYVFDLSAQHDVVREWLETGSTVRPATRQRAVLGMMRDGLYDLSVSRRTESLPWGIRVPDDASHTVYVWLDALVNYLTVLGYPDNADAAPQKHVIGKDILKFHCIYWPAFLSAAGIDKPQTVLAHGHWTVGGVKMSKSLGNVVDPFELINQHGSDLTRFFLMHESRMDSDSDYSTTRLEYCVNELADKYGNLLSRVTSKRLNRAQTVPSKDAMRTDSDSEHLVNLASTLNSKVQPLYERGEVGLALEHIMEVLRSCNRYFDAKQPWVLAKQQDDQSAQETLHSVIYLTTEVLRLCSVHLWPVMPNIAGEALRRLNAPSALLGVEQDGADCRNQGPIIVQPEGKTGVPMAHIPEMTVDELEFGYSSQSRRLNVSTAPLVQRFVSQATDPGDSS